MTAVVALLVLALPSLALASSDMLAAPVRATLSADRSTARPGEVVIATLRFTPLEDIDSMSVSVATNGCMKKLPSSDATPRAARKGQAVSVVRRFEVIDTSPCDIIAQIVTYADLKNRFGSGFVVSVNAPPAAPGPPLKQGRTADGRRVIVAPAAR
jgi:hypothetical protein